MNRPKPYQIPRDCALPSLQELLRIDAEEEARMEALRELGGKLASKSEKHGESPREPHFEKERQSTVERLRKAIERRKGR